MRSILFYFPKGPPPKFSGAQITDEALKQFGLSEVFRESHPVSSEVHNNGPDGSAGLLVALLPSHMKATDDKGVFQVRIKLDEQTWVKRNKGENEFWIGFCKDAIPGPHDLRRPFQVGGHPVKLADGNDWLVPVVRTAADGSSTFPKAIGIDEEGALSQIVLPRYAPFCNRIAEWWNKIVPQIASIDSSEGKVVVRFDQEETFLLAIEALSFNYHMDTHVGALLSFEGDGLITDATMADIVFASADVPGYLGKLAALAIAEKKNGPALTRDGDDSSDGQTDVAPDTPPPSATSDSTPNSMAPEDD